MDIECIAVFFDYTNSGEPLVAIHDSDENFLFSVTIPASFVQQHELEIGDEFRIIPTKTA